MHQPLSPHQHISMAYYHHNLDFLKLILNFLVKPLVVFPSLRKKDTTLPLNRQEKVAPIKYDIPLLTARLNVENPTHP